MALTPYYADLQQERLKELRKILNLDNSKLDKPLASALQQIEYRKSTGVRLNQRIQELLYFYTFPETDLICSCFGAKVAGTYAIYGFLYSQWDPAKRTYEHKYICASPTYRSQDGEYRHRIIPYWQWTALQERFGEVFDIAEEYILGQMEADKLEFNTVIFYPKVFTGDDKLFEEEIDTKRLPVHIFMLAWLYDFYQIHNKVVENHINPAYQVIVYQKSGIPVFEQIVKKVESMGIPYWDFMRYISELHQDVNRKIDRIYLDVGQKIFTMTKNEMVHSGEITYPVWREVYFTRLCADMVINFITPCFSIMNRYFYIQNSFEALFDNPPQHEKYENGRLAKEISDLLTEVDRLNFIGKKRGSNYINAKFFLLSRKINKASKFAQGNIQLIDTSVCLTNEHTGRTLRDIPTLAANDPEHNQIYRAVFSDLGVFRKHMFEFIYTFYCANSKVGIIHGDLHLNNATLYHSVDMGDILTKNPQICYVVDDNGKPVVYSFPHAGLYSMVIDMSRGVTNDRARLEKDFGKRFTEMYLKDQNQRVMRMIMHYFPVAIEKHKDRVENLLRSNFDIVFKLLTLVDPYSVAKNLEIMFEQDAKRYPSLKIDQNIIRFLKRVANLCEVMFVSKFSEIINGKLANPGDLEWPCLTLLKELYKDNIVGDAGFFKDKVITDVFNMMNPMTYSIKKYDTMNELVKLDLENRIRTKHGIDIKENLEAIEDFQRDDTDQRDILIRKYAIEAPQLPEDSSWMFD